MKKILYNKVLNKIRYILFACLLIAKSIGAFAQQSTTVLPNNGSFSNKSGPQGALRYQRELYLITPAEMASSGITNGMSINSIGFTIGKAQSDTTMGRFKLYLENTNDFTSRIDSSWITVNSATNSYNATGLFPGNYEWQVQANCSPFTGSNFFSNDLLSGCNSPYNLEISGLATNAVTLNWEGVNSPVFTQYQVEYSRVDVINWVAAATSSTSLGISGLDAGTTYQWRVKTLCSSGSTAYVYSSFATNTTSSCTAASGFSSSVAQDTLVTLNWANVGGTSYEVRYRRLGTNSWSIAFAFTNSVVVDLQKGTTYEWQVRTICGPGSTGAFTAGSNFVTGGTTVCYEPTNTKTSQITSNSAVWSWSPVVGATSYTIRYRLKNTISWTNALNPSSPMTMTCDSMISVPKTTGPYDIPFANGSPFTYTGGGLYVAWEYSRPIGALSTPNVTLSTTAGSSIKGVSGQDSVVFIRSLVSLADTNLTGLPDILGAVKERPETRLGSASLADSIAVVAVYALGKTASQYQSPTPISALISNKSASNKTYDVTLTIKDQKTGTQRYTQTLVNQPVSALDSAIIQFTGWTPDLMEADSIFVSIPAGAGENVVNNNTKSYFQDVNKNILGYDDGSPQISEAGFGTGSGLILSKHEMKGCGKVISAQVYLTESAKNHVLNAVLLNSSGAIVAQSPVFTPDSTMTNRFHSFYFTSPASFLNEDFYIGLAQQASATSYNPVGTQWENETPRQGAYFRSNLDGTSLVDSSEQGRLMIRAEIVPSSAEPTILGNLVVCTGSTTELTAGSDNKRFANSVIGFTSQNGNSDYSANQSLGTPNVFPLHGPSPLSWVSATPDSQREALVLGFPNPAPINFIDIYETANPGAVDTVYVKNPATLAFEVVYTASASAKPLIARKNRISFALTSFNVSEIRIAFNSAVVPGYNAVDAVAIGENSTPAFSSYLWTPGGETSANKTVNSAGAYKLTVTNASGCTMSETVNVVATTTIPPVIAANGPTAICQGDSVILISNKQFGNTWSDNSTNDSLVVKTAGSYTVTNDEGTGCSALTSLPISIVVNPLPVVSITGSLTICPGTSTTLNAGAGYTSYFWSTGEISQTITVAAGGTYSVSVTNINGCKGSGSTTVVVSPEPEPIITGILQICPGGSTTIDAGASFSSYSWSNGATSQTISVNTAATFSVTVTNSNGCSGSNSISTSLLTAPSPSISGKSAFCPGSSITISANPGYTNYIWSNGSNVLTTSVNSVGTYTVTVTASNGCTGSAIRAISQATPPTPVISGTLSFCGSSSTALNAGSGYLSYSWSTGAKSQSILASTAATFTVTVTDANGCTGSASVTTTKTGSVPVTPGPIAGNTGGVCNSTGNIYSIAAVPNAAFYVWKVPVGAIITSGQGSTSITVSYTVGFTFGNITVAASNACGQSPSRNARTLAITGSAAMPSAILGQLSALCGLSNQVYSISAINGASSYLWTVPSGATIVNGQGTTSITVNFAANFGAGSICVKANSSCGNSANKCILVSGTASVPGAITGLASVCSKAKNVTYSISAVAGATSYTWEVPDQASIVSGQGTTSIVVSYGTKAGNITVKSNNGCGSSALKSLAITFANCRVASEDDVVDSEDTNASISVFPNPAKGAINIAFGNAEKGNYQLIISNIIGQTVYNQKHPYEGQNLKADLSHLQKGFYTIAIIGEKRKKVLKLLLE